MTLQPSSTLKPKCGCGVKAYASRDAAERALDRIKARRLRSVMPKRAVQCWRGQWHLEGAKRIDTGPDRDTRAVCLERDCWACACCGDPIDLRGYSLQHRVARGAGGSSNPDLNTPANLITLCGSATSSDGCHLAAESRSKVMYRAGYWLTRDQDPIAVPVFHMAFEGYVLLGVDGTVTPIGGGAA